MAIMLKRGNSEPEEVLGVGEIFNMGDLPVFRYYHKGIVNTSFVYGWVNEKFEIDGKTFNSCKDFTELYTTLKAEIDLANLN